MSASDRLVEIGIVVRPHGVRGALKVRLHNPDSSAPRSVAPGRWFLRPRLGDPLIAGVRVVAEKAGEAQVVVDRVASRDAAERLRGAALMIPREALAIGPDEVLYSDLIGCIALEKGRIIGTVEDVFCVGASDILVVRTATSERLIPFVDDWVGAVDTDAKTIELRHADQWDAQPL